MGMMSPGCIPVTRIKEISMPGRIAAMTLVDGERMTPAATFAHIT
jgi:hypothetical protein